jgi:outer membrane protein
MKKYLVTFLLVALTGSVATIHAQSKLKIGHINSQELFTAMPESDSAQTALETRAKEHDAVLEEVTVEFNRKLEEYKVAMEKDSLSDFARASKEADLQDIQERIQALQEYAQQDLQQKRMELFTPIQEKAINAVNEVAEENGFTYILDAGVGALVYTSPDSHDILPLVKAKLGIE